MNVIEVSFKDILPEKSETNIIRIGDTILNQFRRLRLLQTGNATDVEMTIVTNFECENENSCNVETDLQAANIESENIISGIENAVQNGTLVKLINDKAEEQNVNSLAEASVNTESLETAVSIEIVTVTSVPSSQPSISPSSVPTTALTTYYDKEFQIRTSYHRFDYSSNDWCATPAFLANDSKIKMRPCKSYSSTETNIQVWKRTSDGQIKLSRPNDNYCLKKSSSTVLRLDQCSGDNELKFTLNDDTHELTIDTNAKTFLVGFDVDRKFSQLRLYKFGSINPSLETWEIKYV